MAIVIDTNCFAHVFVRNSANHQEFKPVLDWIVKDKGMLVYGGSKYKNELKKSYKFIKIFRLLKEMGKVYEGDHDQIDKLENEINNIINDPDFDDPHLPAIIIDTKCKIICTIDKRAYKFIKNNDIYPKGFKTPLLYTKRSNQDLLSTQNIDERLKPYCRLSKDEKETMSKALEILKKEK